ncbi:unnamed protein product [Ectocarpus sp. 6 AP-2014]
MITLGHAAATGAACYRFKPYRHCHHCQVSCMRKKAAEARVAVAWGVEETASCPGPQLNKACLPEHCRGCGLHGEHPLLSDT